MKSLNKRYYIGLFSAAALHGAAHQQPMEYYVLTEKPALRDIKNEKLSINFYVKKDWSEDDIVQKKTDAGYINVSSPELTRSEEQTSELQSLMRISYAVLCLKKKKKKINKLKVWIYRDEKTVKRTDK